LQFLRGNELRLLHAAQHGRVADQLRADLPTGAGVGVGAKAEYEDMRMSMTIYSLSSIKHTYWILNQNFFV
jgi:hypothetical protein